MDHILATWGYVAIFVLVAISSMGPPVGSEIAIGYGGALASGQLTTVHDHLGLGWVILVAVLGEVVGSIAGYSIGRFGGRPLVDRVGKYVLLTHRDLDRAEEWFARRGEPFVLIGRFIPLLRSFVSLAAGLGEMTVGKFLAYTVIGAAGYDALLAGIGYSLGASWHHAIKDFSDAGYVVAALLVLVIVAALVHRFNVVRAERAGRSLQTIDERIQAAARHLPSWLQRPLTVVHIDWDAPARQPNVIALVLATVLSIAGSLAVDAVLVKIAEAVFPSTNGYPHFQFGDYSKLTVVGVVIACVAWPITTRISSTPRWVFFRMAIVVTLVLWLPDVWIFVQGQPAKAVAFLMLMHLAIALVTYNALVHLAPAGPSRPGATPKWAGRQSSARPQTTVNQSHVGRRHLGGWPPRPAPDAGEPVGREAALAPVASSVQRPAVDAHGESAASDDVSARDADLDDQPGNTGIYPITTTSAAQSGTPAYFHRTCAVCGTRHLCRLVGARYICDDCREQLGDP